MKVFSCENFLLLATKKKVTISFSNDKKNLFRLDCDGSPNDVFQNFASAIIKQDFNCSNICNPLWLEPILNTIDHGLDECVDSADYYCMYR